MLLMDADICVPTHIWPTIINHLPRSESQLLSVLDRCIYASPKDAMAGRYKTETPSATNGFITTLGFFQLYKIHKKSPMYPSNYPTAAVSDKVFGNRFNKSNRIWLRGVCSSLGDHAQLARNIPTPKRVVEYFIQITVQCEKNTMEGKRWQPTKEC